MGESTRKWSPPTKRLVALILLILFALVLYQFRVIVLFLGVAFLLAFILEPIVDFLDERVKLSRSGATLLVFALLILTLMSAPAVAMPPLMKAVRSLRTEFSRIVSYLNQRIGEPLHVFGQDWDLQVIYEELSKTLQSFLSIPSLAAGTYRVVVGFVSTIFWGIFILFSAFYLVKDADEILAWMDSLAPPHLREDFIRLRHQIAKVWHSFLRGQLVTGLILGAITTALAAAIGLSNALALGLLAGAMEFLPQIGPVISAVPAVLLALFEGSSVLPISNFWFALIVVGMYIFLQQIEGNILLPRVMGHSLNLHPILVFVAVIAGGSLAGIIGMLLATPTLATLLVVGRYTYFRLIDRDPFPDEDRPMEPSRGALRWVWDQARQRAFADQWAIRPAEAEDRERIDTIFRKSRPRDYAPDNLDGWMEEPQRKWTVVERKGEVVAFGELRHLSDDEWWLEELRVDPEYRRLGVAQLLQAHQIELAEELGGKTLRMAASSYDQPAHRTATRNQFERVAKFLYYKAQSLHGPCPLQPLKPDNLDIAWGIIESSPIRKAANGLYEIDGHWLDLTRERLSRHLTAEEVWGVGLEGELSALAILTREPDPNRLSVGYIDGQPEGIISLIWGLRVLSDQRGHDEVWCQPPAHPPLLEGLEEAGMNRAQKHSTWIFEHSIEEEDNGRERS